MSLAKALSSSSSSSGPTKHSPRQPPVILGQVQRSASFNATCTVPIKITASPKVRTSASFGNCSILAKVVSKTTTHLSSEKSTAAVAPRIWNFTASPKVGGDNSSVSANSSSARMSSGGGVVTNLLIDPPPLSVTQSNGGTKCVDYFV